MESSGYDLYYNNRENKCGGGVQASLASTFTEFEAMNYECNFDILMLSEKWLTENQNLLDYVELSGYDLYYNNREKKRGGRVAAYVRESLKCKIRKDFCYLDTNI